MQKLIDEEPYKLKFKGRLLFIARSSRFLWQYRLHPEALEPFIVLLKEIGTPEKNISNVKILMIAWRKTYLDRHKMTYHHDRYLLGGIGAVNLVLLPALLSLGVSDPSLFIALLFLAISLPLVGCSLFVSFIKDDFKITSYGKVHNTLITLSLIAGIGAMAAAFWHFSSAIGIVFLCLTVLLSLACFIYFVLVRILLDFLKLLKDVLASNDSETQQNTSSLENTQITLDSNNSGTQQSS